MAEIRLKDNESLESALRRFKKQCARAGVIAEVRKREAYEKPSVKRKKKSEAARKRNSGNQNKRTVFTVPLFVILSGNLVNKNEKKFLLFQDLTLIWQE